MTWRACPGPGVGHDTLAVPAIAAWTARGHHVAHVHGSLCGWSAAGQWIQWPLRWLHDQGKTLIRHHGTCTDSVSEREMLRHHDGSKGVDKSPEMMPHLSPTNVFVHVGL